MNHIHSSIDSFQVNVIDYDQWKQIVQEDDQPMQEDPKGIFYEVKNNQGEIKGYLLGTIHNASKAMLQLNQKIRDAFKESCCLLIESADRKEDQGAEGDLVETLTKQEMKEKSLEFFHNIKAWSYKQLPTRRYELDKLFNDIENLNPLEQFGCYSHLGAALKCNATEELRVKVKGIFFDAYMPVGIDYLLIERAKSSGKEIIGLEKQEDDEIYKTNINLEEALIFGFKNIAAWMQNPESLLKDSKAWHEGDSSAIEDPDKINNLVDPHWISRNINMCERINHYLTNNQKVMIAVGAAHVVGSKGIAELLKGKGWVVNQIK